MVALTFERMGNRTLVAENHGRVLSGKEGGCHLVGSKAARLCLNRPICVHNGNQIAALIEPLG